MTMATTGNMRFLALAGVLLTIFIAGGFLYAAGGGKGVPGAGPVLVNRAEADEGGKLDEVFHDERNDGGYYTIVDEKGRVLDLTARVVFPGDEFISADNKRYQVEKVEGDTARAGLIGEEKISWEPETLNVLPAQAGGPARNLVAIYFTHTAESYVPTEGTDSRPGNGGILQVGDVLAAKLRSKGVKVLVDKTPHEPRDANAYRRSRRTAVGLLKQGPVALIDVHRDGVPDAGFYRAEVAGLDAAKVRFVVGRQSSNYQANLDFARRVKAYLDEVYPALSRGIFIGRGDYNQDLAPRSLLIEIGTHTNARERAENGARLLGDALPVVLGITTGPSRGGPGPLDPGASTKGDWSAILWLILALVVGAGAFLLISTGSFRASVEKLKDFTGREWTNWLNLPVNVRPGHKRATGKPGEKTGGTPASRITGLEGPVRTTSRQETEPFSGRDEPLEANDERAGYQKD